MPWNSSWMLSPAKGSEHEVHPASVRKKMRVVIWCWDVPTSRTKSQKDADQTDAKGNILFTTCSPSFNPTSVYIPSLLCSQKSPSSTADTHCGLWKGNLEAHRSPSWWLQSVHSNWSSFNCRELPTPTTGGQWTQTTCLIFPIHPKNRDPQKAP